MEVYCRECGNLMVEHKGETLTIYVCLNCEKGIRVVNDEMS